MPTGVNGQDLGGAPHGERRAFARYRPSSVAYVQLGAENGGVLLDVSEGGLRLSAGETLGWDDAVPVSLQLSYRADPIQATGQIIWISDSKRTAGLQFVSMPETSRTKLRDWIEDEKNRANQPAAADRPAKRPIDFPASSVTTSPDTADEPVSRAKTRSDRLWEALLDQEPLAGREAPRESPASVRKQPVPLPTPTPTAEQLSRRRTEATLSPSSEGRAVERPETDTPPAEAGKPTPSKVTQLPSDRLFRKPARPESGQITAEPPDTLREETAAPQPHAPQQPPPATANTPATAPPQPSRWGRTEPSAAPPPQASAAPAAPQTSSADSIRQAFQAKQAAEARLPRGGQAAAKATPAVGTGHVASLHDDSSDLKFAEWARARGRSGPDFFVDDIREHHRPSSSHGILVGGIMLLCFGVGLVLGVSYLAGPITIGGFTLPSLRDNGSADVTPVTTPVPTEPAANSSTSPQAPTKAPVLSPAPSANATRNPSAPRASQITNSNSEVGTATNDAANPTPATGNTAASNPVPTTPSATSPELAATKESATPPSAASQHEPQSSSSPQTPLQQPLKTAEPSADDSLAMSHAVTVTPPAEGSPAVWVRLPQMALSASGSAAISVQQSVLVPPASTYGSARANQVVIGGRILNSSVQPLYSAVPIDPNGDVVHLRVWVDPQGDIRQIMPGEGRADLIALAEGEVRGWVQYPPRLTGRPIDSVEDVTITFRP